MLADAIRTGFFYGFVGGSATVGFALTIFAWYGLVEIVTFLLGLHRKYFSTGEDNYDGSKRGRN